MKEKENKKQKRDFESRLSISYESHLDNRKFDNLKESTFKEKEALSSNPVGLVSLDFSVLPEKDEEFKKFIRDLCTIPDEKGRFDTVMWDGGTRYWDFIKAILRSNANGYYSGYEFYDNKTLWQFVKDHPEYEFPFYGMEHDMVFVSFWGKGLVLPSTTVTKVSYFDEKIALETTLEDDGNKGNLPMLANMEQRQLVSKELKGLEEEVFDIENFHSPELNTLYEEAEKQKMELEAKLSELYSLQSKMKAEIESKIRTMKRQVFLLETDFYALLSRWGETVTFDRIAKGAKADVEKPLVIQQKTVYLAEDLPRLRHFYNQSATTLPELLQTSPEFLEHISPNDKSITFIKKQRVGGYYSYEEDNAILKFVADLYPSAVGILVRDGENIYLGWADANKVQVGEDSFASVSSNEQGYDDFDQVMESGKAVSRYFIINIVIGLLNSQNKLIDLPVIVDTPEQLLNSSYIVFSNADNQIIGSRYPTLSDYMKYANPYTKKDDTIYILFNLRDGTERGWDNKAIYNRGKGESLLTHDSEVNSGFNTIKGIDYSNDGKKQNYVGADKWQWDDEKRKISPSFKVYENEFVNTNFMTVDMVEEWISNKNIGELRSDRSKLSFEFMVSVLLKLRELILERQKQDQLLIPSKLYNSDLVASFKVIKGITNFTPYQAKRYEKWVESLSEKEKETYSDYGNVLANLKEHLAVSIRDRYFVGYEHPTEPYLFGVFRRVIVRNISWQNPQGDKVEKLYYSVFCKPSNNNDIEEITTFGQKKKAQEFADKMNALPFENYMTKEDQSRYDIQGSVVDNWSYRDRTFFDHKPTWKVYTIDELKAIKDNIRNIGNEVYKEDPDRYRLWE